MFHGISCNVWQLIWMMMMMMKMMNIKMKMKMKMKMMMMMMMMMMMILMLRAHAEGPDIHQKLKLAGNHPWENRTSTVCSLKKIRQSKETKKKTNEARNTSHKQQMKRQTKSWDGTLVGCFILIKQVICWPKLRLCAKIVYNCMVSKWWYVIYNINVVDCQNFWVETSFFNIKMC